MKKLFSLAFLFLVASLFLLTSLFGAVEIKNARAVDLSNLYIRPNRLKANTAPGSILITATTGESVTENGVQVTAGNAWSISSTAGDFTVSTASLPSGVTAWPGIGTATGVSGNAITFPSSSLSSSTSYGFYITGGITTNPSAGDGGNYVWDVATLVGGSPSSEADAMVSISADDQIVVNATVEAPASSLSAVLTSLDADSSYKQDETLNYKITYGSELLYATTLVVQAEWSLGTLQGSSTPSVDILDYVISSASTAYGSTPAVIDLTNRTITWTISSFPASTTGQEVTFQLQTNSAYTGSTAVNFTTSARITAPTTTTDSQVAGQYNYQSTASDKKTCGQSCSSNSDCDTDYCHPNLKICRNAGNPGQEQCKPASSPSTTTTTTTQTTTQTGVTTETAVTPTVSDFQELVVTEISQDMIDLDLSLTEAQGVEVYYGTSIGALINKIVLPTQENLHILEFGNLKKDTVYFFQFKTLGATPSTSDIFSFKTSSAPKTAQAKKNSLTVTGERNLLWDSRENCEDVVAGCVPVLTTTKDSDHQIVFAVENPQDVETISIFLKKIKSAVLGVSSDLINIDSQVELVEVSPGVFQAHLTAPLEKGEYEVIVQVKDIHGNISTDQLMVFQVVDPIRVVDQDGQPIEHARVYFYKLDGQTRLYKMLKPGSLMDRNPLFTDSAGIIDLTLPHGAYSIQVDALGFQERYIEFALSPSPDDKYPEVVLTYQGLGLLEVVDYHSTTILKNVMNLKELMQDFADSHRFYQTSLLVAMLSFLILLPLSLAAKARVSILKLPRYLKHLLEKSFVPNQNVHGQVVDAETGSAVSGVEINILDVQDDLVIASAMTDNQGNFQFSAPKQVLKLQLVKKGYLEKEKDVFIENQDQSAILLKLSQDKELSEDLIKSGLEYLRTLLGISFELILVISLLFAVLFSLNFGLLKTLPLILVSLFNLLAVIYFFKAQAE